MTSQTTYITIELEQKTKKKEDEKMKQLKNKTSIIIPQFNNDGTELKNDRIRKVLECITIENKGATVYDNTGQWIDENGKLYEDKNKEYTFYHNESLITIVGIKIIIEELLNSGQYAVALSINNNMYIIDKDDEITTETLKELY